jgi:hypothetical protein
MVLVTMMSSMALNILLRVGIIVKVVVVKLLRIATLRSLSNSVRDTTKGKYIS